MKSILNYTVSFSLIIYLYDLLLKKALEKLKRQLAEADAAVEERKKPPEETGPKMIGEGLVIDEWVRVTLLPSLVSSIR